MQTRDVLGKLVYMCFSECQLQSLGPVLCMG